MPALNFPLNAPFGDDVTNTETTTTAEAQFFGEDLLFENGDLQLTASSDYAIVSGFLAVRQAVRNRLLTSPGEYATRPDYGCGLRNFVKRRTAQSDLDALRQTIIEQLAQEDRIQIVEDVTLTRVVNGTLPGVRINLKLVALGREHAFTMQTFSE